MEDDSKQENQAILDSISKHYAKQQLQGAANIASGSGHSNASNVDGHLDEEEESGNNDNDGDNYYDEAAADVETGQAIPEQAERPCSGKSSHTSRQPNHTSKSTNDRAYKEMERVSRYRITDWQGKLENTVGAPEKRSLIRQQNNKCAKHAGVHALAAENINMPGAYAAAPNPEEDEPPPTRQSSNIQQRAADQVVMEVLESSVSSGVAVATEVHEDEEECIEQVQQTAVLETRDEAQTKEDINRRAKLRSGVFVGVGILVIIVIVVLVCKLPRDNGGNNNSNDEGIPMIGEPNTTMAPTSEEERMEAAMFQWLPNDTVEALKEENSPQYLAYQWIMADPKLSTYVDVKWRVLQRFALATFYYATNGPKWLYQDHWLSYDVEECLWYSYEAFGPPAAVTGGITGIDVEHANPCELNSTELNATAVSPQPYRHLWFLGNQLQGTLPVEVFWLTSLRSMSVLVNDLAGTMPSQIGLLADLEALTFSRNWFSGSLPTELGAISKLSFLDCTGNFLSGNLPSQLGLLRDLEFALMDFNYLSGSIPHELFRVSSQLFWLYLDYNPQLSGTIPSTIGNLQNSEEISFYAGSLTGTIPSEIGLLQSAKRIILSNNSLTGTIPTTIGQLDTVYSFEVDLNYLTGTIPSEMALMTSLEYFHAQDNLLTGTIPREVLNNMIANPSSILSAFNVSNNNMMLEGDGGDALADGCWVNYTHMEGKCMEDMFSSSWHCGCWCSCPNNDQQQYYNNNSSVSNGTTNSGNITINSGNITTSTPTTNHTFYMNFTA